MLIYAGIDEAGYGPMLGPLCVGLTVLAVRDWAPGDPAPDLWERLAPAVTRSPARGHTPGVPIADSKRLKLSNQSKTRDPLVHLERGVLATLAASSPGRAPIETDAALFDRLGAAIGETPWYAGDPIPLPRGNDAGLLRIDAGALDAAMRRAGVELRALRVAAYDAPVFNRMLAESGAKSGVVERALEDHLRNALASVGPGDVLRVVADRQGSRLRYGSILARVFDRVEAEEESARASRYRAGDGHAVILHSAAEDAHFPVALASMAAKYVRELAMARFNRHWSARVPELKPTAGYVQDARRWLADLGDRATRDERLSMIRNA